MRVCCFVLFFIVFAGNLERVLGQQESGFQNLFDGRTLDGLKAPDMTYWSVEDGAITAKITEAHPCTVNQYLVWRESMDDFELKLKFRITGSPGTNSGFQFRSRLLPNNDMAGYQMDNNRDTPWLARLYEEHGRETLAFRGKKAAIDADGKSVLSDIPDAGGAPWFQLDQWHEYDLVCQGPHLLLKVDGRLAAEVFDGDPKRQALSGLLGLQLHSGPPMTVQFKDIRLKRLRAAGNAPAAIADKTLVAWVSAANTVQRGGSALTLENPGGEFDAVVLGEIQPGKWMAGSNGFLRTEQNQTVWPAETADAKTLVQMAVVYRGKDVSLYRDGQPYAKYTMKSAPAQFGPESMVLMGLRHRDAGNPRFFAGSIDDARIYATALDAATISALKPNDSTGPKPLAWWSFENGKAEDLMGRFPPAQLVGGAKVADGRLHLNGQTSYLLAGAAPPRSRETEDWPTWHITALPEEGHCLPYDTNGCIFWKGRYHLMYIYHSHGRPDGHCWGHASSTDLVNWTFHPASLELNPGEPDGGTFSGNAFLSKEGKPMLCWFGIDAGVCVATAEDDGLIRWKKHPKNPIIPIPKPGEPGHGVYRVWDPYLWLEGDTYYCLLGGNTLPNGKDTLYTMKSPDLVKWERLHPFYEHPNLSWTQAGEDCSCPDFFRLGNKRVLMCISHTVGGRCYVGRFEKEKFYPEQHVRMNWPGGTFFAPESLEDDKGRRIFWAWVIDPRLASTKNATGSGVQSMPRVLSLAADDTLRITPAPEIQTLRRNPRTIASIPLKADAETVIPNVHGDCLELALEFDPGQAREVGLKVRCSPDGKEETLIAYDTVAKTLKVDMSQSTLRTDVVYGVTPLDMAFRDQARTGAHPSGVVEAPFVLRPGETLKLRVFLDKPMLEVFANDRQCVTQQIFPVSRAALDVKAFAKGGAATLRSGEAWDLAPAKFVNEKNSPKGK